MSANTERLKQGIRTLAAQDYAAHIQRADALDGHAERVESEAAEKASGLRAQSAQLRENATFWRDEAEAAILESEAPCGCNEPKPPLKIHSEITDPAVLPPVLTEANS